jgi:hypothetical protein
LSKVRQGTAKLQGFNYYLKVGGLNSRPYTSRGSTKGYFAGLHKPGTLIRAYRAVNRGFITIRDVLRVEDLRRKDKYSRVKSLDLDKKDMGHVTWHVTKGKYI